MDGLHDYPHRVSVHMDGFSADGDPVVGPLPGVPNVLVFGGYSGHGFKMSTAMGQIARELVEAGGTTLPITHLDPARFS